MPMSVSRSGSSPLDALLAGSHADPVRRALWLDALERQLRPHLPAPLSAHARFANYKDGKLVFVVDSPVWHARMRLASAELLDAARSIGLECDEVVVRTTTAPLRPEPPAPRRPRPIPPAAREALQAALDSLGVDDDEGGNPKGRGDVKS